jgi:hypothetical protein
MMSALAPVAQIKVNALTARSTRFMQLTPLEKGIADFR